MQSFSISCGVLPSSSSSSSSATVGNPLWSQKKWRVLPKRNDARKRLRLSKVSSKLELNPLPYPLDSLEPHMSKETLEHHWGRHHKEHVDGLNRLIDGSELDGMELEDVVIASYNKGNLLPPFNHAAQIWNHNFFWQSMKPGGGGRPSGVLLSLIERDFGSFERMLKEFKCAASTQFGSGWAWLVYKANKLDVGNAVNPLPSEEDNKLVVVKSPNAVNPLIWDYSDNTETKEGGQTEEPMACDSKDPVETNARTGRGQNNKLYVAEGILDPRRRRAEKKQRKVRNLDSENGMDADYDFKVDYQMKDGQFEAIETAEESEGVANEEVPMSGVELDT